MKRIQLENRTELWNEIPLSTPYVLFVDPSNRCNLKCDFCMNSKIENKQDMSMEMFKDIIEQTWRFDKPIKTLRLYGFGEPFMNPFFTWMIAYARANGNIEKIDTTTNGLLIHRHKAFGAIESGLDRINISVNEITDELVDNVRYLYEISKYTTIFVKTIDNGMTDDQKQKFYQTFKPISHGCDIEYLMKCWYDVPMDIEQDKGIYGQPLQNVEVCPYIFYQMMIHSDGTCSLCFLDWNKKMVVGDISDGLDFLWVNYRMHQRLMLKGVKPEICKNCNQLKAGWPVDLDKYKEQILERL